MRTGIKTAARKIAGRIRYFKAFYPGLSPHVFPLAQTPKQRVARVLDELDRHLRTRRTPYDLGVLYTVPHADASAVYKRFIKHNPGNLGVWSDDITSTSGTTRFEYDVIHAMIDLYHGNHTVLGGYITSGGTEGNIYSVWLGRTTLEKTIPKDHICLILTNLTHYSLRKAANICGIPQFITPLHVSSWSMDPDGILATIHDLYTKGYRGFIIPLTIGYTVTGTNDDIDAIENIIDRCKRELKGIQFFSFIDGALSGLIVPFLDRTFRPFRSKNIRTFVVDFHKFGLVPYPAGIVIYTRKDTRTIEQPIAYLPQKDATLLGSRSGIPAVSVWTMIHRLGMQGYTDLAKRQMENKTYFLSRLRSISKDIQIITDPKSLSCGLIFRNLPHHRLTSAIESRYSFYPAVMDLEFFPRIRKKETLYTCFFLPHMTKAVLDSFISDIRRSR